MAHSSLIAWWLAGLVRCWLIHGHRFCSQDYPKAEFNPELLREVRLHEGGRRGLGQEVAHLSGNFFAGILVENMVLIGKKAILGRA